jgi:hypothetical protein
MRRLVLAVLAAPLSLAVAACSNSPGPGLSVSSTSSDLTGCDGTASSAIPASGVYFLTSFGDSPSDNGEMSCGEYTDDGSWYYAASRQRYGCGSHIQIEANGRCVVAATDDYGPDECVESAAGGPIIDASPLVAEQLFGVSSAGWSDHLQITVTEVSSSTPLGPCSAGGGGSSSGAGSGSSSGSGSGAAAGSSSGSSIGSVPSGDCQLAGQVYATNTCTETLQCDGGSWVARTADPASCATGVEPGGACVTDSGSVVPENTCTTNLQCDGGVWVDRYDDPASCL